MAASSSSSSSSCSVESTHSLPHPISLQDDESSYEYRMFGVPERLERFHPLHDLPSNPLFGEKYEPGWITLEKVRETKPDSVLWLLYGERARNFIGKYNSKSGEVEEGEHGWEQLLERLASSQWRSQTVFIVGTGLPFQDTHVAALAEFLQKGTHLRNLGLVSCKLGSQGWEYLAEALQSARLDGLTLSDSPDLAAALLQKDCLAKCSLSCLELRGSVISKDDFARLAKTLCNPTGSNLLTISLFGVANGSIDFPLLAEALRDPKCQLQQLYLHDCNVTADQVGLLCVALRASNNCKLRVLSLEGNLTSVESTNFLCDALGDPRCPLQALRVGSYFDEDWEGIRIATKIASALESRDCNLIGLEICGGSFEGSLQALLAAICSSHCKLQRLAYNAFYSKLPRSELEALAAVLKSKDFPLLSLNLRHCRAESSAHEKILIDALEKNRKLTTLHFDWQDGTFAARCSSLLNRNRTRREGGLLEKNWVKPRTARLYICGHNEVGKTTLRKGLRQVSSTRCLNISSLLPSCSRREEPRTEEPRTRGAELETLSFGNRQLILCDLAGQKEYHAFHHIFVSCSHRDLFLVVCKIDDKLQNLDEFACKLRYWLRFIVSHRSGSSPPKVMVVVNFFHSDLSRKRMMGAASRYAASVIEKEKFQEVLDFGKPNDSYIFGVVGTRASHLVQIHRKLGPLVAELLDKAPEIPQMCEDLASLLTANPFKLRVSQKSRKPEVLVQLYSAVVGMYSKAYRKEDDATFEAALKELHYAGLIVYFPDEENERGHQVVIRDCAWFCRHLMGVLLEPPKVRQGTTDNDPDSGTKNVQEVMQILRRQGQCEEEHLGRLLNHLEKLQLLYRTETGGEILLVPALLSARNTLKWPAIHVSYSERDYKYFGRRLGCADKEKTLLPFGVFCRLQVRLHNPENKSYKVGYCTITYSEDMLAVILRYGEQDDGNGEDSKRWEENQYIDIMIRYPVHLETEALQILEHIKGEINVICGGERGCMGVTLEESLMRTDVVKKLSRVQGDIITLSKYWEKVREKGLVWHYSWSDGDGTLLSELVSSSELKKFLDAQGAALLGIAEEFSAPEAGGGSNGKVASSGMKEEEEQVTWQGMHSISGAQNEETRLALIDLQKQVGAVLLELQKQRDLMVVMHHEVMGGLADIRKEIGNVMTQIRLTEESILSSCSNHLVMQLLEGPLPAFPFLTDKRGRWQKLQNILGKELRLHLMCESPTGRHPIDGQKGVSVTVRRLEWLVSVAPVLVPALQVLCCAARIAASIYLPVAHVFIPSPDWIADLGLDGKAQLKQEFLRAFAEDMPTEIQEKVHAPKVIERSDWVVLSEMIQDKSVNMRTDFNLRKVKFKARVSWVCDKHVGEGEVLPHTNPFSSS